MSEPETFLDYRKARNPDFKFEHIEVETARELDKFRDDWVAWQAPKTVINMPPICGKTSTIVDFVHYLQTQAVIPRVLVVVQSQRLATRMERSLPPCEELDVMVADWWVGCKQYDIIILDNILKPTSTSKERDKIWDWMLRDLSSRAADHVGILIMETRQVTDDITGRCNFARRRVFPAFDGEGNPLIERRADVHTYKQRDMKLSTRQAWYMQESVSE